MTVFIEFIYNESINIAYVPETWPPEGINIVELLFYRKF